jgi:hypothetical protein
MTCGEAAAAEDGAGADVVAEVAGGVFPLSFEEQAEAVAARAARPTRPTAKLSRTPDAKLMKSI